ncbi:MAG: acyl-CoA dehydrogenase [Rhodospirillaceae bacterium]|nr:acyl-CoA dehydrogenase [Rhodospirillaceae bacterium]
MVRYAPPIREMTFVLEEIVQLPEILGFQNTHKKGLPKFDTSRFEQAQRFATEYLLPLSEPTKIEESIYHDGQVICPPGFDRAFREFYQQEWLLPLSNPNVSTPINWSLQVALQEIWHAACPSLASIWISTISALDAIKQFGSPALQEIFLPALSQGKMTASIDITEEQAGSDLRAIKTRAWPVGNHHRISGQKQWVTYGQHSLTEQKIHLTLAKLQGSPMTGDNLSLFMVPQYTGTPQNQELPNDVFCQGLESKLALTGCPISSINFGPQAGAIGFALGDITKGHFYTEHMLQTQRLLVCTQTLGISERVYQESVFFARARIQGQAHKNSGSVPIIMHPDVRRVLMTMRSLIQAMRSGVYFAAGALDRARNHFDPAEQYRYRSLFTLLLPILKNWCSQYSIQITTLAMQIHAAAGNRKDSAILQSLHNAFASLTFGGTNGMLAQQVITSELLEKNGASVRIFLDGMRETIPALTRELTEDGASIRFSLEAGIDALEETTDWILENYRQNSARILAGANPYIHLFGTVYMGWLLAEGTIASKRLLGMAKIDPAVHQNRLLIAKFYADSILPQAEQDAITVMGGCSSILELPIISF